MARRRHSSYKPGTESYARERATLLKQRETLAKGRASRAKRPEAKKKALQQASRARAELRKIQHRELPPPQPMFFSRKLSPELTQYRNKLSPADRVKFNQLTTSEKYVLFEAVKDHPGPGRYPPNLPDLFPGSRRNVGWSLYYATRAGTRLPATE